MAIIKKLFRNQLTFAILHHLAHHPQAEFFVRELARAIQADPGNVQRELKKLEAEGFVIINKRGKHTYVRLNASDQDVVQLTSMVTSTSTKKMRFVAMGEEDNMNFLTTLYNIHGFVDERAVSEGIIDHIVPSFFTIEDGLMKYWVPEQEWQQTGEQVRQKLLDGEINMERVASIYTSYGDEIIGNYHVVKNKLAHDKEHILQLIARFREIMSHVMAYSWLALVDLKYYAHTNYVKEYIEQQLKKSGKGGVTVAVLMERLLQPDRLTFTQKMRLSLLELARDEQQGRGTNHEEELHRIHDEYRWLNFGWHGPESTYDFFVQNYEAIIHKSISEIEEEVAFLRNITARVQKEKEQIYHDLAADERHRQYIDAVALLSWLKVYRKDILFCVNWITFHLLEPYRQKSGWSVHELAYITLDEVPDFLAGNLQLTKKDFRDRVHFSVLVGGQALVHVGVAAKAYVDQFELVHDDVPEHNIRLLNGMTACLGKTGDWVYGTAKIVNTPEDMDKLASGDILVSVATTPDILPAMKKAAAMVTDQGGITSHAAIVSRELNIPCLIGTQYATKVFKDGDQIVVCPRHAYVRLQ